MSGHCLSRSRIGLDKAGSVAFVQHSDSYMISANWHYAVPCMEAN